MKCIILGAIAAATVAISPASANTVEVTYDDLNLASAKGQAALEARIERAVRSVCEVNSTGSRVREQQARSVCAKQARASAKTQMAAVVSNKNKG